MVNKNCPYGPSHQTLDHKRNLIQIIPTDQHSQSKDTNFNYVHFNAARHVDIYEDFCKDKLPDDEIYVPPHNQPINPEDEDDIVPDQHAAFGIQRATQKVKEPAWKDLGLEDLMKKGPQTNGNGKILRELNIGSQTMPR